MSRLNEYRFRLTSGSCVSVDGPVRPPSCTHVVGHHSQKIRVNTSCLRRVVRSCPRNQWTSFQPAIPSWKLGKTCTLWIDRVAYRRRTSDIGSHACRMMSISCLGIWLREQNQSRQPIIQKSRFHLLYLIFLAISHQPISWHWPDPFERDFAH